MWDIALPLAADLVAITVVVAAYFRRHQRRDLVLAYVALNVGVLAVTMMLASAPVGAGLGLGLFGILSIIRLRSDSITQEEIAYYFVALALGLLAGLHPGALWVAPALSGLLVVAMLAVDHPRVLPRARRQLLTMDRAVPSENELRALIEERLGVHVKHMIVQEVDFVRDVTVVDVRFRRRPERHGAQDTAGTWASDWAGQEWPASAAATPSVTSRADAAQPAQPAPSWPSPARPVGSPAGPARTCGEQPDHARGGLVEQLRQRPPMTTGTLTRARDAVDRAAGLMPTLDLAEVTAAADLQTRTDRKYLVPAADFLALTRELDGTLAVLEIEGRRTFEYESVYFDTPELLAYHAHARGRRRRFKVRTRTYLDSGQCALEIKTEGGRGETVKDRHPYAATDRYTLTAGARQLVGTAVGSRPLAERLQTSLVTRYARTTIVDTHTRSRMTCDVDLAFSDDAHRRTGPGEMVLVESKTVGAAGRVDTILWRLGHRPVALSKYCAGLALLDPRLPANRWSRTLRRGFAWRPASSRQPTML